MRDSDFTNYGMLLINEQPAGETCTVIVVGLPRSGTSMVAAVLNALGIFIGDAIDQVVFEDREIGEALNSNNGRLQELIAKRDAAHKVWGFKRPEAYRHLAGLCASCRNPRVIATFRDILAISLRNKLSMQIDPVNALPRLANQYRDLTSEISRLSVPCLLLSYEKALLYPTETVEGIANFCGIRATERVVNKAANAIENGRTAYLQSARLRYHGFVGRLVGGQLRGWVKALGNDHIQVTVDLLLDDKVVQSVRANLPRPDVQKAGFGDPNCGFSFPIDPDISRNSLVEVRVQNSRISLQNSGLPLKNYETPAD